jgi:hypothetical protein
VTVHERQSTLKQKGAGEGPLEVLRKELSISMHLPVSLNGENHRMEQPRLPAMTARWKPDGEAKILLTIRSHEVVAE